MILIPPTRALYAAVDHVDFRRSFDALVAIAREQLVLDALRSAGVLLFSRDRTRCKLVFHDGGGIVILYKRLDRGHFTIPAAVLDGHRSVRIEARELPLLLNPPPTCRRPAGTAGIWLCGPTLWVFGSGARPRNLGPLDKAPSASTGLAGESDERPTVPRAPAD